MDPITPLTTAQTAAAEKGAVADPYILRVLISVDMLANVALGGQEDETISTDTGLMAQKHQFVGTVVSKMLNLFQKDHGAEAAAGDLARAQAEVTRLEASGIVNS